MLDDDLLSHGEAPHYHRRCIVSLLSSERDQVVPMLYVRQAILLGTRLAFALRFPEFGYVIVTAFVCGSTNFRLSLLLAVHLFFSDYLGVIWSSLTGH